MPALTALPTVSVFHSNAKISSAKIKKYTTASEKGIGVYDRGQTPSPALGSTPSPSQRGTRSSMGPPPPRRQRPNHPVNPPVPFPGTTAAPRSRRRKRVRLIQLDRDIVYEDGITMIEPDFPPDSDVESDVSSRLTTPPPSEKASPEREATPEDLEYGAGFASYYVIDDDDGEGKDAAKAPPVKAPKPTKKQDAPKQPPPLPVQTPQMPPPRSQQQTRAPRSRPSIGRPTADQPPQGFMHAVPPPTVNIVDNIRRNPNPSKPATASEMIAKLDVLSQALVKFGATPPPPRGDDGATQGRRSSKQTRADDITRANGNGAGNGGPSLSATNGQGDDAADGLLAAFDEDGDSDDEGGDHGAGSEASHEDLSRTISIIGISDDSLSYGVQFIMNALSTWAKQRIDAMYHQQWLSYNEMVRHHQQLPQQKKNRGRPKKGELEQTASLPQPPPPPSVINAELTTTPEGEAVQAFQNVIDCGVLRVNGALPETVTRALRTLYVQIDHLINNSAREQPHWECISYQAQIKAHSIKVERWKEQAAKIQVEMAKQQELSHQQMMSQMGVPPHMQHRGVMSQEQALRHRDMSLELKRSEQQASHQPHLTQYLTTPMDMEAQKTNPLVASSKSASPANGGAANVSNPLSRRSSSQHIDLTALQPSGSRVRDPMSRMTIYHDGKPANVAPENLKLLSMRSGQGMKFSFDHGEGPRKVFGDQAFPSAEYGSNIPRRGPMGKMIEQPATANGVNGVNGHMPPPVLGSNAPPLNGVPKGVDTGKKKVGEASVNGSAKTVDTGKEKAAEAFVHRRSSSSRDTTLNGVAKAIENKHKTNASSATSAESSAYTHKRKHSETVNGSAPASPAPKRSNKIRLSSTKTAGTSVASPAAAAAVVGDE